MKTVLLSLAVGIFSAGLARADVSDSGNLNIGRQAVISGTMTVQGNAFSVGGSTFVVIGSSVGVGTTNPGYNLDVQGTGYINAAGALCIAGVCNTTWPNTSPWTTAGSMVLLVTPGNNVVAQSSLTVQGNAFSVGGSSFTLAGGSATVAYQLTAGSLNLTGAYGNVVSRASVTAAGLFGDGSNIANLSGANVAANSITNSQLAPGSFGNITGVGTLGSLTVSGAANFAGSGIWNALGNVGIGTASPAYALHAAGGSFAAGQQIAGGTMTVQGNAFSVGGSTFSVSAGSVSVGSNIFTVGASSFVVIGSSVGIGITNPAYAFHNAVGGEFVAGQQIAGGTLTVKGSAFSVGTSSFVVVGSSVGVQTTNPQYSLEAAGYINATQALCIAGTCKTTWPSAGASTYITTQGFTGNGSWVRPAGVNVIEVWMVAGGGGGGSAVGNATQGGTTSLANHSGGATLVSASGGGGGNSGSGACSGGAGTDSTHGGGGGGGMGGDASGYNQGGYSLVGASLGGRGSNKASGTKGNDGGIGIIVPSGTGASGGTMWGSGGAGGGQNDTGGYAQLGGGAGGGSSQNGGAATANTGGGGGGAGAAAGNTPYGGGGGGGVVHAFVNVAGITQVDVTIGAGGTGGTGNPGGGAGGSGAVVIMWVQ